MFRLHQPQDDPPQDRHLPSRLNGAFGRLLEGDTVSEPITAERVSRAFKDQAKHAPASAHLPWNVQDLARLDNRLDSFRCGDRLQALVLFR
jgi:hypothetical protein